MPFTPVLRSEALKVLTLRSLCGTLLAVFAVTTAFSALAGSSGTSEPDFDPLYTSLSGVMPGQIAAIAFGAMVVSSEYHRAGIRVSLAAVPRRGRWFAAKMTVVALPVLVVGTATAFAALLAARTGLGPAADGLTTGEQVRAVVGCGVYLTLIALFAAGLTTLFCSGVATLSVLIPFILIVSFVIGDAAGGAADFLPDKAGQIVLHQSYEGPLGPATGLAVTAAWAAAALLAGAWRLRHRDA
ncbi:ABC transporter permease [Streptomyces sp. WAC06273]|uniref:ABC transporter permease n=1 Tax=Streptomyces sp. WAC06273 TaxID=2487422 RepID=UPI000F74576E|nr:ABC transporter permease [Streptomyces sp. WAC06273]RSS65530.1 ABC transporter permease [Streptomyces sp. WAC06273]